MNKHSFRLVAAIVSLSGCGDDDSDRPYRSGVDEEENVSTLDDDDKAQICRTLGAKRRSWPLPWPMASCSPVSG